MAAGFCANIDIYLSRKEGVVDIPPDIYTHIRELTLTTLSISKSNHLSKVFSRVLRGLIREFNLKLNKQKKN